MCSHAQLQSLPAVLLVPRVLHWANGPVPLFRDVRPCCARLAAANIVYPPRNGPRHSPGRVLPTGPNMGSCGVLPGVAVRTKPAVVVLFPPLTLNAASPIPLAVIGGGPDRGKRIWDTASWS